MLVRQVLVVENDLNTLNFMAEFFSRSGTEVISTSEESSAIALLEDRKFDGIVVDLDVPQSRAAEVLRVAESSPRNHQTPIAVIAGLESDSGLLPAFALAPTCVLHKPVDSRELDTLVSLIRAKSKDPRRYARVALRGAVACTVGNVELNGQLWNVGQGGLQVEVPGLQQGDSAQVTFRLPRQAQPVRGQGSVMWARDDRQGIQFTELALPDQLAIRAYVARFD